MPETKKIDLSVQEVYYTIGKKHYVLVEASAEAGAVFKNTVSSGLQFNQKDNNVKIGSGWGTLEVKMLSLCLFEIDAETDEKGNITRELSRSSSPVSEQTIKKWPNKAIKQLYEELKTISELGESDSDDEEGLEGNG